MHWKTKAIVQCNEDVDALPEMLLPHRVHCPEGASGRFLLGGADRRHLRLLLRERREGLLVPLERLRELGDRGLRTRSGAGVRQCEL